MMHVVDYYPTLVKLAGGNMDKAKPLDGLDLWPTISNGEPSPRTEVVYNIEMFRGAVRQKNWKLFWRATLPTKFELYDLDKDAGEKMDLAAQNPEHVKELRNRVNDLAGAMTKSLLLEQLFGTIMKQVKGKPPVLPNEDSFYESPVNGD